MKGRDKFSFYEWEDEYGMEVPSMFSFPPAGVCLNQIKIELGYRKKFKFSEA